MRILLGNAFLRIHHQDGDVGFFNSLNGLDDGKLFYCFQHFAALTHTRSIDKDVVLAVAFKVDMNGVARRARLVEGDDPLFAKQCIHQGRLAYIGPADKNDGRQHCYLMDMAYKPPSRVCASTPLLPSAVMRAMMGLSMVRTLEKKLPSSRSRK